MRIHNITIIGNVEIGKHTYINEFSTLITGTSSKIQIGQNCAIGRNVHISSKTHDLSFPTTSTDVTSPKVVEKNITIGNNVWIGDNVFIREGVHIESDAIVGANSVVTHHVKPFEIVGGVPAKHIRFNSDHINYKENR